MLQLGIEHNSANNKCMNDSAHGQCVGSLFAVGHIYRQRLWQGVVSVDLQEMYIDMWSDLGERGTTENRVGHASMPATDWMGYNSALTCLLT